MQLNAQRQAEWKKNAARLVANRQRWQGWQKRWGSCEKYENKYMRTELMALPVSSIVAKNGHADPPRTTNPIFQVCSRKPSTGAVCIAEPLEVRELS